MNKNTNLNQSNSKAVQQAKKQRPKPAEALRTAHELAKLFNLDYLPLIPSYFYIKDGYLYERMRPGVPLCSAVIVYAKVKSKKGEKGLVLKIKEGDKEKEAIIGLDFTVEKILLKIADIFDLSFTPKMLMSVLEYIASYERLNKKYIKEIEIDNIDNE